MIFLEPGPGEHIIATAKNACDIAKALNQTVWFEFNQIDIEVKPGDCQDDIAEKWRSRFNESAKK